MKSKVNLEDTKTVLFSFVDTSQNWRFSLDIKPGYHHIDIFPPDQEILGFSWFNDGFTHFYKFTVLPSSLSTGPYIFIKVMSPLVRYWRLQAFRIPYLLVYKSTSCISPPPIFKVKNRISHNFGENK